LRLAFEFESIDEIDDRRAVELAEAMGHAGVNEALT
jgi:hypothetical protein